MADPLQLRTCQEVLGKLPEKQSIWGSALWPFLKGVEGFDTERASDCLVKLLNNHYDTIAVLQLAEKRDLVEDAGILPGDALRIIRAARDYVPRPPDSRLSEPPTPTSNAYRPPAMRDLTGILTSPRASDATFQAFPQQQQPSALDSTFQAFPQQQQPSASDSTFQAIPQQEKGAAISQQGAPKSEAGHGSSVVDDTPSASLPTAPPPPPPSASQRITAPKTINYPHTCRLCNAKCPGEVQYLSHYNGQKHIAAVIESKKNNGQKHIAAVIESKKTAQAAKNMNTTTQADLEPSSSNPKDEAPLHACGLCPAIRVIPAHGSGQDAQPRAPPQPFDDYQTEVDILGQKVMVTVASKGAMVEKWLNERKEVVKYGLDIEWRPTFQKGDYHYAALLQLSHEGCCLLIQLQFIDKLPDCLKTLLVDPTIMKGGVGIMADTKKLKNDCDLICAGQVELTTLAVTTLKNSSFKKAGIATLTDKILGVAYKKNKRATMSNWEIRDLTHAQIQYAAADAWLSYSILMALLNYKEPPPQIVNFEATVLGNMAADDGVQQPSYS